jgi:uncharacterized protein with NAD-binding domain and iron-sulfur cluster
MVEILVFGGGISGLTSAHELLDKGFNVSLIEKENILGGMAKTRREKNGVPSEHSWRGFGPFYKNTFDILKRIPCSNNKTAYDNLSKPVEFFLLSDKERSAKKKLNFFDYVVVIYYSIKYIIFGGYYDVKVEPLLKDKLSRDGYDFLIEFLLGPGYGMEKKDASYGHFFKFLLLHVFSKEELWQVNTKPTHEAWIEPWRDYLISKGLKIHLNTQLLDFNKQEGKIESCSVYDGRQVLTLKADEYIVCLDPFNSEKIIKGKVTEKTESNQISFRLGFNKNIKFPVSNIAFVMTDSEFNITWYPQEHHWDKDVKIGEGIKSLWSGTIVDSKKAITLDKNKLMEEIINHILRSESLQNMIKKHNNFYLIENDIKYKEVWYEWLYNGTKMVQKNKKWGNNVFNEKYRQNQTTEFTNLYLGGAHTKTSTSVWSMEGAVESGKLVSQFVSNKYNKEGEIFLFNHEKFFTKIRIIIILFILLFILLSLIVLQFNNL